MCSSTAVSGEVVIVRRVAFFATAVAVLLALPASASALTVSKAQLVNGELRVEGSGAAPGGSVVIARSATSVASARIDTKGGFRIQAAGFRSDDCTIVIDDGSTPIAQPRLAGCTPAPVTPPIVDPPPPSGGCVIAPGDPATFTVGDVQSYFFTTTGCDTTNGPVQWALIAGRIPPGMDAPIFQGQTAGMVSGRPTTEGAYTFSVQVTDSAGATDIETFTINVIAPRPLTVTTATLPQATRDRAYQVNLAADGGLPNYAWALKSGTLPRGMQLSRGAVPAIAGTPTTAGTFVFTVTVTDSRGTTSDRTLSLTVT
jgi:Putative Ig domain